MENTKQTIQNTKDIVATDKIMDKNTKNIDQSKSDIRDSQIDIISLFERVVRIEAKLDMFSGENRTNDVWTRTSIVIIILIEVINLVLNALLFIVK